MNFNSSRLRAVYTAALLGTAALLLGAPTAQAGLAEQAVGCDTYTFEQPFFNWERPLHLDYVLAPDGGFENRARYWTLSGGARSVHGNETYYAHRHSDSHSLYLPPGSSATSPAMCAGVEYPTLRMFGRNRAGGNSTLKVEMLYDIGVPSDPQSAELFPLVSVDVSQLPHVVHRDLTGLTAGKRWGPTPPLVLEAALGTLGTLLDPLSGRTAIAFRFTPQGNATWWIDDAYVDPYRRY